MVLLSACHRIPKTSSAAIAALRPLGPGSARLWLLLQCQLCRWGCCTGLAGRLLEEPMAGPLDGHSPGWAGPCPPFPINRHSGAFPEQTRVAHGCCSVSWGQGQTPAWLMLWELMPC